MTAKKACCISIETDPNVQSFAVSNSCACVTCTCCSLPFNNLNDSEFYELFYALEYNTICKINKLDLFSLPKAKYQTRYLSPKQIGHIQCNINSKSLTYFHFNV